MDAVDEEILTLRAIYGDENVGVRNVDGDTIVEVQLSCGTVPATVRTYLPRGYPAEMPALEIDGLSRAQRTDALRAASAVLDVRSGDAVIFDLCEAVRSAIETTGRDSAENVGPTQLLPVVPPMPAAPLPASLFLAHGEPAEARKSIFLGWAARVRSESDVAAALSHIRASPRVARATHPAIFAYTFTDAASGRRHTDCDDDGESAAGRNLSQLLANMGANDCLVVVTRWFGGVLLGPTRFRVINEVARSVLVAQPWFERGGSTSEAQR